MARARRPRRRHSARLLADIYNGAAHGLFRARDPSFRDALAALRASGLPISRRHRVAELVSDLSGQQAAVRLAELWTISRQALRQAGRDRAPIRTGGQVSAMTAALHLTEPKPTAGQIPRPDSSACAVHLFPGPGRRHRNPCRRADRALRARGSAARWRRRASAIRRMCMRRAGLSARDRSPAPILPRPTAHPTGRSRIRSASCWLGCGLGSCICTRAPPRCRRRWSTRRMPRAPRSCSPTIRRPSAASAAR